MDFPSPLIFYLCKIIGFCSSLHLANGHPKSNNNSRHWPFGFPDCYWRMMVHGWVFGLNTRSFSEGIEVTKFNQKNHRQMSHRWYVHKTLHLKAEFVLPLNLGIASWNSSTTILTEKPTKKWQQFPTKKPHQILPSARVESLRPEDRLWFETGPRWRLGNFQNLQTHQVFHKVSSLRLLCIMLRISLIIHLPCLCVFAS